jgi:hypothetical protein
VEVLAVADVEAPLEAPDAEGRQRVQRLLSPRLPQLKAIFLRRQLRSATTIRNCLFTLFQIEDAPNETGKAT